MKFSIVKLICIIITLSVYNCIYSQVSINTTGDEPDNSAILDISSTDRGFYIPRMTTAQRNAIASPANSLMIFNTDDICFQIYVSSQWNNIWCFNCSPSITSHPSDQTICDGDSTSFSVSATGQSLNYQWQVNTGSWNDISAAGSNPTYADWTTATLGVNSVVTGNNGYQYRCIVSGSCSPDATSNAGTLTVSSAPAITSHPSDESISVGENANFSVTATGAGLTYQWQEDNGGGFSNITDGGSNPAYSGATTAALTLTNVPVDNNTFDYRCIVGGTCSPAATSNSANLTVSTFSCGTSTVSFTYRGSSVEYGTVANNSECWLDRNLGASQVATAYNDANAYGDLFQWGRLDDNHQDRTSGTTSTNSSTDNPGHSNFILEPNLPRDWRIPQNNDLWQEVGGTNNPCPSGWRIPTEVELNTERGSWGSNDYNGAYGSPLKIVAAGNRNYSSGSVNEAGSYGYYWSYTVSGVNAYYISFDVGGTGLGTCNRGFGFSVRCIKD